MKKESSFVCIYVFVLVSLLIAFIMATVFFTKTYYVVRSTRQYDCLVVQKTHENIPCRQGPDPDQCDHLVYRISLTWKNLTLTGSIGTESTGDPNYLTGSTHKCYAHIENDRIVSVYWFVPANIRAYAIGATVLGAILCGTGLFGVVLLFINHRQVHGPDMLKINPAEQE